MGITANNRQSIKTALITGASSGFGLLTTVTLAKHGWKVIATMRNPARRGKLDEAARAAGVLDRIEVLPLDVTNQSQIDKTAAEIARRPEPLDALVNNAGFSIVGFVDDVSHSELRNQFDTNFFGSVAVTQAFLPQLRRQGFGHIVMLSSISGLCGFPGFSSYAASKHALEGWAESMRMELLQSGIQTSMVEPGSFSTDIWANAKTAAGMLDPTSPNAAQTTRWRKRMKDQTKQGNPQVVADGIVRILEQEHPKFHNIFGQSAKRILVRRRLLPWRFYERMIMKSCGLAG
jgi:NAD(P)-dependent dehydrogenase (short-subunit alcohol dehydrogenase family)